MLEVPALFEIERDDATVGLDGEQLVPVGLGLHVSIGRAQVGYVPPVLRGGKYGASEEASRGIHDAGTLDSTAILRRGRDRSPAHPLLRRLCGVGSTSKDLSHYRGCMEGVSVYFLRCTSVLTSLTYLPAWRRLRRPSG